MEPFISQADQFSVGVDPMGNVGIIGRDTATLELPGSIIENTRVGSFFQGSAAFGLSDLEVTGPGMEITSITGL